MNSHGVFSNLQNYGGCQSVWYCIKSLEAQATALDEAPPSTEARGCRGSGPCRPCEMRPRPSVDDRNPAGLCIDLTYKTHRNSGSIIQYSIHIYIHIHI